MPRGDLRHRRRARVAFAAACTTAGCLASAASAGVAATERPDGGDLSPRLAELAKPSVRSLPEGRRAATLDVPRNGAGSLLRRGPRILVEARFDGGAAAASIAALRAAGAKIVYIGHAHRTITAAVRPSEISRLRALSGVRSVVEVLTPIVQASGAGAVASSYTPCFGAETSEGDVQLRAADARAKFEVEGAGVEVGVLSDSFDRDPLTPTGASEDVASGDLPGPGNPCGHTAPVDVLDDSESEGGDEGRAMAQIVHDLAPRAALSFATAFSGEQQFADNIRALAAAGAEAIVDDVSYFEEPFFQEGPVGVAISEVTEDGVAYFSAAGNDNLLDAAKNEIGSWEAPAFRDAGGCPAGLPAYAQHCMDFNPGGPTDTAFEITVPAGGTVRVDLQWAQPWNGVTTDLDAYLLSPANTLLAGLEIFNVSETQRPFEFLSWTNGTESAQTVRLAINRCDLVCGGVDGGDAGTPRLKFIFIQSDVTSIEYPQSSGGDVVGPTIFGHNGGEDAMSVGAIRFNTTAAPETFSSRGPVTHYFEPVTGAGPALPLGSPLVLPRPDVLASDGGANTFFGSCSGGAWRFFGTSAAAPHATAVAALQREAEPLASAEEVKQAQREEAVPVPGFPATAVGSGMVEAVGALEWLGVTPPSPSAVPATAPPPGPCLPSRSPVSPSQPAPPPQVGPPTPAPPSGASADTTDPRTFIAQRPPKVVRTTAARARVVFRFASDEAGVVFVCRIDGAPFRPCSARLVRRFRPGPHTLRAVARDGAGNSDPTPAVYRFRVKRVG